MKTYLVCFDISDTNTRRKVGNLLLRYGDRVQESVFEIVLRNDAQMTELKSRLLKIATDEPVIHFYAICSACRTQCQRLDDSPLMNLPSAIII